MLVSEAIMMANIEMKPIAKTVKSACDSQDSPSMCGSYGFRVQVWDSG